MKFVELEIKWEKGCCEKCGADDWKDERKDKVIVVTCKKCGYSFEAVDKSG